MKAYLLAYSQACTPQHVQHQLNDMRAVSTWITPFPFAAIVVSDHSVNDLAAVLRERLPGVWFMVTELRGSSVQGWLPRDLWDYVNCPSQASSGQIFAGLETSHLRQPPAASPPEGGPFAPPQST